MFIKQTFLKIWKPPPPVFFWNISKKFLKSYNEQF